MSEVNQKSFFKRLGKLFLRFFIVILILFLFLYLLLNLKLVQNYIADYTADTISKKTEAEVKIGDIDFSMSKGLLLNDFSIKKDTSEIIKLKSLNVSLLNSLYSIIQNKVSIKSIGLNGAHIKNIKEIGKSSTSFEEIIKKLRPSSENDPNAKKIELDIKRVSGIDISYFYLDKNTNEKLDASINKLNISIENFDNNKGPIVIDLIKLDGPDINLLRNNLKVKNSDFIESKRSKNEGKLDELVIKKLVIKNGKSLVNTINTNYIAKSNFDKNNFLINDINLVVKDVGIGEKYVGIVDNLSLRLNDTWFLNNLKISNFAYHKDTINVKGLILNTPRTYLNSDLTVTNIFTRNNNPLNPFLKGSINKSEIDIEDISYFVPALKSSPLIEKLGRNSILINTKINGNLSSILLSDLNAKVSDVADYRGNIKLENIADSKKFAIQLDVTNFNSTIEKLESVIPNFKAGSELKRLKEISYNGIIKYGPTGLGANGIVASPLGYGNVDVNFFKNNKKESFKGKINLKDFELGTLLNNPKIGKISFDLRQISGNGFDFEKSQINVVGDITKIEYNNNVYGKIFVDGKLEQGSFEGKAIGTDPNLDLEFDGFLSSVDKGYDVKFYADLRNIDLQKLGLVKYPMLAKGKINMEGLGNNINDFVGNLEGKSIEIIKRDTLYHINDLRLNSKLSENGTKQVNLKTENINVALDGYIDYTTIVDDAKLLIATNFPYYTKDWVLKPRSRSQQNFKFDIDIASLSPFDELLGVKDLSLPSVRAKGLLDVSKNEMNIVSSFPRLKYKNEEFFNGSGYINLLNKSGEVNFRADSSIVSGRKIKAYDVNTVIEGDKINFSVTSKNIIDSIERLDINGFVTPHPKGYQVSITNNFMVLFGKRWKLSPNNNVAFGKSFIDIKDFMISDGDRSVEIVDIQNKGLQLKSSKFRLNSIQAITKDARFKFDGELTGIARVEDVFLKSPDLFGEMLINDFSINGDPYGDINLDISKPVNENLKAILSIDNTVTKQSIKANIDYNIDTKAVLADLKGRKVPLKWLEYILSPGIKDLKGFADLDGKITGSLSSLKIKADAVLRSGSVKIVYLGETYSFDNEKVKVTENFIDLTGDKLFDTEGNSATITGGIKHRVFRNFDIDATIESEKIVAMRTTKVDNPLYYGIGKGSVLVRIKGLVDSPNMYIDATTTTGTEMNIPLTSATVIKSDGFITFVNRDEFTNTTTKPLEKKVNVGGLRIEMNLNMTQQARVNLIFDETIGDVIKGYGTGNMRIISPRVDPLEIYGEYEILEGEYLFTAKRVAAKQFQVKRGSLVRWSGDPLNALINIEADYPIRTGMTALLQDFLINDDLKNRAAQRTAVNVKLILGNTLFKPSIRFDLEFPELTGDLKNYATSKLRLLRNNESEYNSQVFSLMIFNTFVPSGSLSSIATQVGDAGISAAFSTLSEFISSQVSLLVTGMLNDALSENGLISGIDFNLNLRNNTSNFANLSNQDVILPTEIEVRLNNKFRFWDERLEFNVGGNYVRQGINNLQNYFVPDFYVQLALTDDRKLNLKVYGRYDIDEILAGRRQMYGLGLRYRTEFGSMLETKSELSDYLKKTVIPNTKGE